jgi:hypothetical protein
MESYQKEIHPCTLNLFENESTFKDGLIKLLSKKVGYNSCNHNKIWHPSFNEIRGDN